MITMTPNSRTNQKRGVNQLPLSPEIAAGNHRQNLRTKPGTHHGRDTVLPKTLDCCEGDRAALL